MYSCIFTHGERIKMMDGRINPCLSRKIHRKTTGERRSLDVLWTVKIFTVHWDSPRPEELLHPVYQNLDAVGKNGCDFRIARPKKHRKWSYSSIVSFKKKFSNAVNHRPYMLMFCLFSMFFWTRNPILASVFTHHI